jgi:hypothetical protein
MYDSLHPAVLRALAMIAHDAERFGIDLRHGQQVLGQVVRSYRDKIDPAGQLRQHKDHRRHLQQW